MPSFVAPKPVSETALRDLELRLSAQVRALAAQVEALNVRVSALHLGSTCHPEWINPGRGNLASARRASIVEAVLATADTPGMTMAELAAYLHLPRTRHEVLLSDLSYLIDADRVERTPTRAKKWRIKER
jgi:hypothetical protein